MRAAAIGRVDVEGGWGIDAPEGAVVANRGPEPSGLRLAFCQDRHRRVPRVKPEGRLD